MKKLLKILKKIGLVLASVLVLAFIVLLIIGVPKPPAISAENVPRVSLSKLKGAYSSMNNIIDEARFLTWSRNDDKMYIQKIKGFQPKLYILDRPGGKPQLVEGIPDYARVVAINPKPKTIKFSVPVVNSPNKMSLPIFPKIKGTTIRKENLAAFSRSIPNKTEVEIVAPEREMPGKMEIA